MVENAEAVDKEKLHSSYFYIKQGKVTSSQAILLAYQQQ
jgi:hypothetical protein